MFKLNESNKTYYFNWTLLEDFTNDTVFITSLLIPSYLIFIIANSYIFGRFENIPRNVSRKLFAINILRFISIFLLLSTLVSIFVKHFINIDGNKLDDLISSKNIQSIIEFSVIIILDVYQLIAMSIHTLVLFNKSVFINYPLYLIISFIFIMISNFLYYFSIIFTNWNNIKNYDLTTFDKFNFTSLFIFNFLLVLYFVTLMTYFTIDKYLKNLNHFSISDSNNDELLSEEDNANYLSYISFNWLQPIMIKGFNQEINTIDELSHLPADLNVYKVCDYFMSKYLPKNLFQNTYDEHNENNPIVQPELLLNQDFIKETTKQNIINPTKNKLASTLIACFGRKFLVLGIFKLSNDIISFSGPLLLSQLVQFVETKNANLKDGCFYATTLFVTTLIGSIVNIHFTNSLNKLCLRIKTALITLIYRKAVVVRLDQLNKYSTGQIVNYMSIDTDSVVNAFPSFHSFWSLPFQICITLYLLYSQIGISFVSIINFFPIYFYNKYCLYLF